MAEKIRLSAFFYYYNRNKNSQFTSLYEENSAIMGKFC